MATEVMRAVHTDYLGNPIGEPVEVYRVVGDDTAVLDSVEVPTGDKATIEKVLAWAGYDPDRLKAAQVAEHSRGKNKKSGKRLAPRSSLIAKLNKRLQEGQSDG